MTLSAPLKPHPARLRAPDSGVCAIASRAAQLTDAVDQLAWTDEASQAGKSDAAAATAYADVHRFPSTDVRRR